MNAVSKSDKDKKTQIYKVLYMQMTPLYGVKK
jgi:hypothetical protein